MSLRLTLPGLDAGLRISLSTLTLASALSMLILSSASANAQSLVLNGGGADASASTSDAPSGDAPTGTHTVTFQNAGSTTSQTKTPVADSNAEAQDNAGESKAGTLVLKGGTTDSSSYEDALAIECPQPELTAEHNEQGIKTSCSARFVIDEVGKFSVRLVSSTGSQEVDDMALATLRRWKFKPAQLNGKAVKSSRKIKIEFEIE